MTENAESKRWKTAKVDPEKRREAARVRFKIKGATDGPVYQGQEIIMPCVTCYPPKLNLD